MPNILVLPQADIDKFMAVLGDATVIIARETLAEVAAKRGIGYEEMEEQLWDKLRNYDFGGEADYAFDLVTDPEHYVFTKDEDLDEEGEAL